jgi:hypothetical protein
MGAVAVQRKTFMNRVARRSLVWLSCAVLVPLLIVAIRTAGGETTSASDSKVASVAEMIEARTDVWGDAAMRAPNGATYEFFADLLPPLRWVNTDFRHYPIVLSVPLSPQKLQKMFVSLHGKRCRKHSSYPACF